jgi:hypothetical protein
MNANGRGKKENSAGGGSSIIILNGGTIMNKPWSQAKTEIVEATALPSGASDVDAPK